jgi:hypothetical protein
LQTLNNADIDESVIFEGKSPMCEGLSSDTKSRKGGARGVRHLRLVTLDGAAEPTPSRESADAVPLRLSTSDGIDYLIGMVCELKLLAQKAGHANLAVILDLACREAEVQRMRVDLKR